MGYKSRLLCLLRCGSRGVLYVSALCICFKPNPTNSNSVHTEADMKPPCIYTSTKFDKIGLLHFDQHIDWPLSSKNTHIIVYIHIYTGIYLNDQI